MSEEETTTCEGPFAHMDLKDSRCPRCGQLQMWRVYDESDDAFRKRIKTETGKK